MEFNYKTDPVWKQKDVIGLDIGTKYIKVVQLGKKKKAIQLVGYGHTEVPENFIIEGIISEPEKLAVEIKKMLATKTHGKVTATRVNASLPESKIFTRIMTLPNMKVEDIQDAISWEATQSVPIPLTDLYLDWKVIGPNANDPKSQDIIFAAAPKSIVNSYVQLFQILGMEIVSLETSLNAIARAIIPAKTKNACLIIDLGGTTANIAIFDKVIRVTGSVMLNSELFALAKETKSVKDLFANDSDGNLSRITAEAASIIKYYNEKGPKQNSINKVYLCGGNANKPFLTEFFAKELNIETTLANPWSKVAVQPFKPRPKIESAIYTNSIGLALLGVEDD